VLHQQLKSTPSNLLQARFLLSRHK
jgi:hypothetical protein